MPDLFGRHGFPDGFRYEPELISPARERDLLARFATLPFEHFEMRGRIGNRRVVSFGWRYDFGTARIAKAEELPPWLVDLRALAARFAGLDAPKLEQSSVIEYTPGSAIGWHGDRPVFGEVVGVSLAAPCLFRLRRQRRDGTWDRRKLVLEPRSVYLLSGVARDDWEHSVPPVETLRYSVTFRNLRAAANPRTAAEAGA